MGKKVKTYRITELVCPYCQAALEAIATAREDPTPKEEDISVCIYCAGGLKFVETRTGELTIVRLTQRDVEAMDKPTSKDFHEMVTELRKHIYGEII